MSIRDIVRSRRGEVLAAAARHGARNVRIFGSAARGEDDGRSDVDIIVSMEQGRSLLDLVALNDELEGILGRRVDVITEGGVSPYLRERIRSEALAV